MCLLRQSLDLKTFMQRLQGRETPSKWEDSMCLLMSVKAPSLAQTLQTYAPLFWLANSTKRSLLAIIEITVFSNIWNLPTYPFGNSAVSCFGAKCSSDSNVSDDSLATTLVDVFLIIGPCFWTGFVFSRAGSLRFPSNSFSFSSSAKARKASKFSWEMFASPR